MQVQRHWGPRKLPTHPQAHASLGLCQLQKTLEHLRKDTRHETVAKTRGKLDSNTPTGVWHRTPCESNRRTFFDVAVKVKPCEIQLKLGEFIDLSLGSQYSYYRMLYIVALSGTLFKDEWHNYTTWEFGDRNILNRIETVLYSF